LAPQQATREKNNELYDRIARSLTPAVQPVGRASEHIAHWQCARSCQLQASSPVPFLALLRPYSHWHPLVFTCFDRLPFCTLLPQAGQVSYSLLQDDHLGYRGRFPLGVSMACKIFIVLSSSSALSSGGSLSSSVPGGAGRPHCNMQDVAIIIRIIAGWQPCLLVLNATCANHVEQQQC
jgi:hypothetical protein